MSYVESSVRLCWFTDDAEYMDEHSAGRNVAVSCVYVFDLALNGVPELDDLLFGHDLCSTT